MFLNLQNRFCYFSCPTLFYVKSDSGLFMVVDPNHSVSDEESDHQLSKLSDVVKSRRFLHG